MKEQNRLYSSRLLYVYVKLLQEKYPEVSIADILSYADIEPYEISDESCWFTQQQVDRFYEKTVQLSGNKNIAREAGRLAAAPGTIGALWQHTFGLLGPALVFKIINRLSKSLTYSSEYSSRTLELNQVEITVIPHEGVEEKPFQCENRMGFFEAIIAGFHLGLPKIEHPECLFQGGKCCRYIITWKKTLPQIIDYVRNGTFILVVLASLLNLIFSSFLIPLNAILVLSFLILGLSLASEILRRGEMTRSLGHLWESSEKLTSLIDLSSRNSQLVHEIGQALVNKNSVEEVLDAVSEEMKKGLNFDSGMILLANPGETRLAVRAVYGFTSQEVDMLLSIIFHLDNPRSKGPFVQAFQLKKPLIINDTEEILEDLSDRSRDLVLKLGINSFLCCPIIVAGETLGVIAVSNKETRRPLVRSDINLLQGIAPVIGVALQNAGLVEELQNSFEKTLKALAASIDARDYLTAGHSEAVTEYAAGIAEILGQSEEFIQIIRIASLLHDYGKIGVPDAILKKNGRLSEEERNIIYTHPARTEQILRQVPFRGLHKEIPIITGAHHERWDGEGYPRGLKGEDIPLGARILAVADFFEAITAKRHYREPMSREAAIKLLRESSGNHFDPKIVEAFLEFLEKNDISPTALPAAKEFLPDALEKRRRSLRLDYRSQISGRLGQRIVSGDTLNIGSHGVYIVSADPVCIQDRMMLTLMLPNSNDYTQTPGEVVWINNKQQVSSPHHPEGFGMKFINPPAEEQALIDHFLQGHLSPPGAIRE